MQELNFETLCIVNILLHSTLFVSILSLLIMKCPCWDAFLMNILMFWLFFLCGNTIQSCPWLNICHSNIFQHLRTCSCNLLIIIANSGIIRNYCFSTKGNIVSHVQDLSLVDSQRHLCFIHSIFFTFWSSCAILWS